MKAVGKLSSTFTPCSFSPIGPVGSEARAERLVAAMWLLSFLEVTVRDLI